MADTKCKDCKYCEFDYVFRELWCKRKGAEVNDDDSCKRGEREYETD